MLKNSNIERITINPFEEYVIFKLETEKAEYKAQNIGLLEEFKAYIDEMVGLGKLSFTDDTMVIFEYEIPGHRPHHISGWSMKMLEQNLSCFDTQGEEGTEYSEWIAYLFAYKNSTSIQ